MAEFGVITGGGSKSFGDYDDIAEDGPWACLAYINNRNRGRI